MTFPTLANTTVFYGCPMCGSYLTGVRYCVGRKWFLSICRKVGDHLHRGCLSCGYAWDEPGKKAP